MEKALFDVITFVLEIFENNSRQNIDRGNLLYEMPN